MSRRSANLECSIRGDELEQNRIKLEHNLQHTDLSLHLSSAPEDDSDVEYPRHHSGHSPLSAYASFEQRSEDRLQSADQSRYHAWSYRTPDEDDGAAAYAPSMASTAAHHASALTLSAGLGGRQARRDLSVSGAEYDPDRPLQGIVAGMITTLDIDSPGPRHTVSTAPDFDPLVVDNTSEIDLLLQSGHAPTAIRASDSSSSATSISEPASIRSSPHSPRPKLSDALYNVAFSPKRPCSAQGQFSPRPRARSPVPNMKLAKPLGRVPSTATAPKTDMPIPKPRHVNRNQSLSYAQQSESGADKERNPFGEIGNQLKVAFEHLPPVKRANARTPSRGKVYLPDVTGLTEAVATPAKVDPRYYEYEDNGEIEARLLATLNVIQAKIAYLESENSISRRRVRELEIELQACKHEVARERTKIIEHEEVIAQQHADAAVRERQRLAQAGRVQREQAHVRIDDRNLSQNESRYKEVVEEKKALEALITTLRTHLSRLTVELSDHQHLLIELRTLRDSDARALAEKSKDIDHLRQEVERLAGEVEVLRGVVEEGLKERRTARENASFKSDEDTPEHPLAPTLATPAADTTVYQQAKSESTTEMDEEGDEQDSESEDETSSSSGHPSPSPSPRGFTDRTMRTDFATAGSTPFTSTANARQFVDSTELGRISAEVSERQSERSSSSVLSRALSRSRSLSVRSASPALSRPACWIANTSTTGQAKADALADSDDEGDAAPPAKKTAQSDNFQRPRSPASRTDGPSRPAAPTPRAQLSEEIRAASGKPHAEQGAAAPETPFPQIRGARLERLFFSAPEHNVETCTVCHRRRRHRRVPLETPSWMGDRRIPRDWRAKDEDEDEDQDEGFVDGEDEDEDEGPHLADKGKGREPRCWRTASGEKLPPQTVLARVLRDLEDDFMHYKGIYIELAEQYGVMDAAANVVKRNVLATHLREVIDILEQKGDQIASLYDLLTFKDKPTSRSVVPDKPQRHTSTAKPSLAGQRSNQNVALS